MQLTKIAIAVSIILSLAACGQGQSPVGVSAETSAGIDTTGKTGIERSSDQSAGVSIKKSESRPFSSQVLSAFRATIPALGIDQAAFRKHALWGTENHPEGWVLSALRADGFETASGEITPDMQAGATKLQAELDGPLNRSPGLVFAV